MKSDGHGAIMIVSNADGGIDSVEDTVDAVSNTYTMGQEDYVTWKNLGAPETNLVDSGYLVENTIYADPFFQFFYCGGSRDHIYSCYKYQVAIGRDEYTRFDTDSTLVSALSF